MDPDVRERLLRLRFLPTRPELSDPEVAARLDAGQPHLQAAQESAARGDAAALRRALADHLDACVLGVGDERDVRFPADWYDARSGDVQGAEAILRGRVAYVGKLLDVGPRIDWHAWDYPCAESRFVRWFWMHPLVSAYRTTGRERYARGAMDIVRGFYADARPPAQRPATWYGYNGPWQALMAAGRVPIALDLYRTIGRSDALDDSDRVTFLKLLLEHAEFLYTASERHIAHNWEVAMMVALLELAHALPGFRDSTRWKERAVERFTQNMRDCVLDDGGYWERSEYHFSAILEYAVAWRALREAGEPIPPEWPDALQRMYEWAMWVLTPQRQYPPVGHAAFGGGRSYVSRFDEERWGGLPEDSMVPVLGEAADLFPERSDFGWFETGRGRPPERTSRVLPHTGWLVMRSGWEPDDLYLIMNYNGSPDVIDTHPDLLSVSVWAHGRAYLSNSGSTHGYEAPEFRSWDMQTRSSNTVMVDGQSQAYLSNGGRLQTWESLPGFDYAAAASRAYERLGVDHHRAVLLVKPRYWVIHDVLEGDGGTHEYRWHGHFQPTELTVDTDAGMIATDDRAGTRLFTACLPEDGQTLEQDTGPISTPAGTREAPYVALVQRSARPVAFTAVLYPATAGSGPPDVRALPVTSMGAPVATHEAVGCRVTDGTREDFVLLARSSGSRACGLVHTDGEAAYVSVQHGRVTEAGLTGGTRLTYRGRKILAVDRGIAAAGVRFAGDRAEISCRGSGRISLAPGSATSVTVNGTPVPIQEIGGRLSLDSPATGALAMHPITVSEDPLELCLALGVPFAAAHLPDGKESVWAGRSATPPRSVLLRWETSAPADSSVEYRRRGARDWLRTVNPEARVDHRVVLSDLDPGQVYQVRVTCRDAAGTPATARTTFRTPSP
jgi:hypothetical protein